MADNLTVSIGIDTAKLRADAAIVKEELRKVSAEVTKAAKAGDVPRLQAATQQQDQLIRQRAQLTQQINNGTRATIANTRATITNAEAHVVASRGIREATKAFGELLHAAGLGIPGLRALRLGMVALGGVEVVRALKSGIDSINELNNAAAALRVPPEFLKQMRQASTEIGQDAKVADAVTGNLTKNIDDAILKSRELGQSQGGVDVSRGGMGRRPSLADVSGLQMRGGRPGFNLDEMINQAGGLIPFILGRPLIEKQLAQERQRIAQRILAAPPAIAAEIAQRTYGTTFETAYGTPQAPGAARRLAMGALPEVQAQTEQQAQTIADINKNTAQAAALLEEGNQSFGLFLAQTVLMMTTAQGWKKLLGGIGPPALAEAVATPILEPGMTAIPGQASGGLIRGAGSGTSDSILARLSNGEFVVNAASVRRLGTGFLSSLNGFALGGLVGAPPIGFASGGLVSAGGGGRAVHLHLGGQVFATTASASVASALVSEAHRQAITSTGVKPGWFAGRPSGQ